MLFRAYRNWRIRRGIRHFMAQREEFHRVAHDMPPDELLAVMQTHLTIRADMPAQPMRDFGHWVCQQADYVERIRAEQMVRFTEHFE